MNKSKVLFLILFVLFFYIFFKGLQFIWSILPLGVHGLHNIVALGLTFFVLMPVAVICAQKVTKRIFSKSDFKKDL
ncbi:hypothetical protein ACLM5H_07415 [Fredinandcohnia humi]